MDEKHLEVGMEVIVRYGPDAATPVCCLATVRNINGGGMLWLDVRPGGPEAPAIPQMFRVEEVLGVPSLDISRRAAMRDLMIKKANRTLGTWR